ncbi:unnamed protein product [Rotaria magnacalcarata]|uniref:Uncharacterized protein n=1 Tax=Rotaria magnacalcarata TaxID=392030 RepID=A0A816TU86_9BILA|nr:unnamed protein product [Rotaria magnacalcarata]
MARIKRATPCTRTALDRTITRLPLALKPSNSSVSWCSSSANQAASLTTANSNTNSTSSLMKDTDNESGAEAQYDLATSIEESGGIEKFLVTPCMVLYKRHLIDQVALENYISKHLSSYNTNKSLFAGVKGTEELKHKINEFYRQNRKKSMNSTILFKGNSSRTTITQQILLKNGNLYLYVDGVMKNRVARNKRKRVCIDTVHDVGEVHGIQRSIGDDKLGIHPSMKHVKRVQRGKKNDDEEEKSDVENNGGCASGALEGEADENTEEETSQTNVSVDSAKRKHINWKGGSKNYRANAIVQFIASNVEVVSNPHFVAPTAKKPLFEYYGEGFELGVVSPAKSIPIPRTIIIKYREEESIKKKTDADDKRGQEEEEEESLELMKENYLEKCNSEDDHEVMEVDDEPLNKDDNGSSYNKQDNTNNSEEDLNDIKCGVNKKKDTFIDLNMLSEDCTNNGNILSSPGHSKGAATNNDHENNIGISSTQIGPKIKNVVERCSSPNPGKVNSSITIYTEHQLSPISSSYCTVSTTNDQTLSGDTSCSISHQHSNTADNTTKTSPLLQQQRTPPHSKQKQASVEKVDTAQTTPKCSKRRSFALRSKTKAKTFQSSAVMSSTRKQNDKHSGTAPPPAVPSKKRPVNNSKKSARNYETLTKKFGKIPKKTHTPLTTVTSNDN